MDTYKKIGVCGICKLSCGIEVSIKDNKVIDVRGDKNNPLTKGYICPNYSTAGSHCHCSKMMANTVTVGTLPTADYKNSKCITLWGCNPENTTPFQMIYINNAIKDGARLIVVDPQEIPLAKRADIHLKLRPGTDGALALGLIHVIIKENIYDSKFVENWTIRFEKLTNFVKDYTPERVSKITCVSPNLIIFTARMLTSNRPTNFSPGIAIELQSNGFQTARTISMLEAIMCLARLCAEYLAK